MKAITTYVADDGSLWDSPEQALDRDRLVNAVEAVLKPLGCTPLLEDEAFYQHDPGVAQQVRAALAELSQPDLEFWQIRGYFQAREPYLNDDVHHPLSQAWGRLKRIDKAGREYARLFFAR
jgi:hypothetical protein